MYFKKCTITKKTNNYFEGHGVDNATVKFDPNEYTKDQDGKKFDTTAAFGDCMVATGGKLYSAHDLRHELVDCQPDRVVITLDCCRDRRGAGEHLVRLR